jgi:hypothetical protein
MKNTATKLLKGFGYVWICGAIVFTIYSFIVVASKAPSLGDGFWVASANWPGYVLLFVPAGIAFVIAEHL